MQTRYQLRHSPAAHRGRHPTARRWNAVSIPVPSACVVLERRRPPARQPASPPAATRRPARWPRTLTPMNTDPHRATPTGKPRARSLGLTFRGTAGPWNAITDVPGVEVGYETLIQGDKVRTGVTAIHPRGKDNPGDPVAAGFHSQNGNGEMTGVSWIEESGTFEGPVAITNTHSVGIAHAGIISWMNRYHPEFTEVWLLPVAAETWDGYLNDINGHHVTEETVIAALEAAEHEQPDEGSVGGGTGMNCYQFKAGWEPHPAKSTTQGPRTPSACSCRPTSAAGTSSRSPASTSARSSPATTRCVKPETRSRYRVRAR